MSFARALVAAALPLLAPILGFACSATSESTGAPAVTADAGTTTPKSADEVPAVRLAADITACPDAYQSKAPKSGVNRGFSVAGQNREFVLLLPPEAFTGPRPVLVGFNGTGETGPIFQVRAQLKEFADAGFIVLVPSSAANGTVWPVWDGMRTEKDMDAPNKDLELFDTLLACNAAHFELDKNRIYIAGHSAGGIFTNYVAQRRSNVIAGAIPASGMFSSTSPTPAKDLDKMLVIVTWGGDNDKYSGSVGGMTVPEANFVSEASLATKFYAAQKNVGQSNCRGKNLNHVWLPINDWFIKVLLAHPKGFPGADGLELPPVENNPKITCTTDVFDYKAQDVTCGASKTAGCQESCQLFADCAVENGTVYGAMKPQLAELGLTATSCGDCITQCEAKADTTVMSCIKAESASAQCGPGINGAQPLMDAINKCCDGKRTSSPYCKTVCDSIAKNSIAITYFTACQ